MNQRFTPTRTAALERLSAFVPEAGRSYAARRNFDLGPENHAGVSQLSPYLRCRLLTEKEVLQAVVGRHSPHAAEKFIQEVFWRTYWKGWLEMRPAIWSHYLTDLQRAWDDVQTQSGLRSRWEAACTGQTDIECFNLWSQELVNTGYIHNHARMWFASIWIFTLQLPWVLGADFFLRHLLDGDPASNTLGWRWVAGIQTPGKTYLARASNISKYTEGRFHPKWQLAGDAPAVNAPPAPEPCPLPTLGTPDPELRTGFVVHEDDLSFAFAASHIRPLAYAVLTPQTQIGPLQPAAHIADFRNAAQADSLHRHLGHDATVTRVQDARTIVSWAAEQDLQQIVTPYAPVGQVATQLDLFERTDEAPRLVRVMRTYDQTTWPHALKGFFPFKKQIPLFLEGLNDL